MSKSDNSGLDLPAPPYTATFAPREKHESNPCQLVDLEAQKLSGIPSSEFEKDPEKGDLDLRSPSPIHSPPSKSVTRVEMPSRGPSALYTLQTTGAHAKFNLIRGLDFIGKCIFWILAYILAVCGSILMLICALLPFVIIITILIAFGTVSPFSLAGRTCFDRLLL